jgi:general secretion pathway protein N
MFELPKKAPKNAPDKWAQRSSSPPWALAATGLVVGVILALLLFAPARWLAAGVAQATGSRVLLLDPTGSAWRGSARLVLGAGSGSRDNTALPGRVQWTLRPSLQGLQLALQASCCFQQAWLWTATPSFSGVRLQVSDQTADQPSLWPSDLLAGLGTPWNTLQLKGTLALSTQQLTMEWRDQRWHLGGQMQLDITQVSTSLTTLKPMGSYRLNLVGGESPTLNLSTLEGSLQLTGSGRWEGGRLQFDGEASAAPERVEALANLLNIIGRRDGARAIIKVG